MLTHNDIIFIQDALDDVAGITSSLQSHFERELENDLSYHGYDSVDSVDDEKHMKHFSYLQRKLDAIGKMQRKLQRIDSVLSNTIE